MAERNAQQSIIATAHGCPVLREAAAVRVKASSACLRVASVVSASVRLTPRRRSRWRNTLDNSVSTATASTADAPTSVHDQGPKARGHDLRRGQPMKQGRSETPSPLVRMLASEPHETFSADFGTCPCLSSVVLVSCPPTARIGRVRSPAMGNRDRGNDRLGPDALAFRRCRGVLFCVYIRTACVLWMEFTSAAGRSSRQVRRRELENGAVTRKSGFCHWSGSRTGEKPRRAARRGGRGHYCCGYLSID